jgi:RsiW-degrading membrane proteinase PrsW (M82 family)
MGILIVSLGLALLPSIILVYYFYKKDSLKPEPTKMIRRAFFLGVLAIIPAILLEIALSSLERNVNPWIGAFMKAFVVAALVEELSKFFILWLFLYKNPNFDEVMDGIVYMAVVSLGFAGFENVMYSGGDIGTGIFRAFTAVPGHAIWSGIMGYYVGLAKMRKSNATGYILKGLFLGVLYHGLYDFVLFAGSDRRLSGEYLWLVLLIAPILVFGGFHLRKLIALAKKEDAEIVKSQIGSIPMNGG